MLFNLPDAPDELELVDSWFISRGFDRIAGVDEAGRGALAGPVCAAAVILGNEEIDGLDDSKRLRAPRREELFEEIWSKADGVGVAMVGSGEIDRTDILKSTMEAMRLAVSMLPNEPDLVLVDGNRLPAWSRPAVAIIKGDRRSRSIMAASIVAKVTRDAYMRHAGKRFPEWGFEKHKGYGARAHLEAIAEHGIAHIHRRSFAPCREIPGACRENERSQMNLLHDGTLPVKIDRREMDGGA